MKYFECVSTIEELRKRYRELLKQHHPDNGGDVSIMQEINAQYDALFDALSRSENAGGKTYTKEDDERFRDVLQAVSSFNISIEIIGEWIWAFDCFQYKDKLKELGFKWAAKKKAWTWHSEPYRRHHNGEISLDEIREKYGSQTVKKHSPQHAIN